MSLTSPLPETDSNTDNSVDSKLLNVVAAPPGEQRLADSPVSTVGIPSSVSFLEEYMKCHGFPCSEYEEIRTKMSTLRKLMDGVGY